MVDSTRITNEILVVKGLKHSFIHSPEEKVINNILFRQIVEPEACTSSRLKVL